jgi:signal transduction histidine kinase
MDSNGKRMLRLVNQLLDFRKIQKNKMTLKIQEVEIIRFVKEVFENFKPLAQQKNILFTLNSDLDHQMVWIDPDKLDSVLFNILSNAFKFSPRHKHINVHITKKGESELEIICTDEGKGISPQKISMLFQRYTPLSGTDVNYQGTGIGLALS